MVKVWIIHRVKGIGTHEPVAVSRVSGMQRDARARRLMVPVLMAAGVVLAGCQSPAGTPGTPTITSGGPIPSAVGTPGDARSRSIDAVSGADVSTTGPSTAAEVRANVPEAARKHTPDGAGAFVRYYISTINLAALGKRKGIVSGLTDAECGSCGAIDADIDDLIRKNHRYQDAPLKVKNVYPHLVDSSTRQLVNATVEDVKTRIVDSNGKTVQELRGGRSDYLFDLRWTGIGWTAREIQVEIRKGAE